MIHFEGVSKSYDTGRKRTVALADVSLRIERGEFVAVMGPSGSGKSTLLHLSGALDLPSSGVVSFDGRSTSTMSDDERANARRERIGFVFQFFNLLPTLSLEQNVALPRLLGGQRLPRARTAAAELLERVGLGQRRDALPDELSGGELQRAAIARALLCDPPVLLADEPTGNLDSATGNELMRFIADLAERDGKTVVIVTHDADVAAFAGRIVRLRDGRIETDSAA